MANETAVHVIIGAGPVGTTLANLLADEGQTVRVLTRSGSGPDRPEVDRRVVDAADAAVLTEAARGAAVIYNCANPGSYSQWDKVWPPLAESILTTAERTGAVLVTMSNLYAHGPVTGPMTRHTPLNATDHKGVLRGRMWFDALAAHESGRVRVTEARASDYFGPSVSTGGSMLAMYAHSTLAGKAAMVFTDVDQPHTWTAIDDVAATLAAIGADERAWGSPWVVPSNPPASIRQVLSGLGERAGVGGSPTLRRVPDWLLAAGGAVVPLLREVRGVLYQFNEPFVADGSETSDLFGVTVTPWNELMDATAVAWKDRTGGR